MYPARMYVLSIVLLLPPAPAALVLDGRWAEMRSCLSAAAFLLIAVAGPPGAFGDAWRAVVVPVDGELIGDDGRGEDCIVHVSIVQEKNFVAMEGRCAVLCPRSRATCAGVILCIPWWRWVDKNLRFCVELAVRVLFRGRGIGQGVDDVELQYSSISKHKGTPSKVASCRDQLSRMACASACASGFGLGTWCVTRGCHSTASCRSPRLMEGFHLTSSHAIDDASVPRKTKFSLQPFNPKPNPRPCN